MKKKTLFTLFLLVVCACSQVDVSPELSDSFDSAQSFETSPSQSAASSYDATSPDSFDSAQSFETSPSQSAASSCDITSPDSFEWKLHADYRLNDDDSPERMIDFLPVGIPVTLALWPKLEGKRYRNGLQRDLISLSYEESALEVYPLNSLSPDPGDGSGLLEKALFSIKAISGYNAISLSVSYAGKVIEEKAIPVEDLRVEADRVRFKSDSIHGYGPEENAKESLAVVIDNASEFSAVYSKYTISYRPESAYPSSYFEDHFVVALLLYVYVPDTTFCGAYRRGEALCFSFAQNHFQGNGPLIGVDTRQHIGVCYVGIERGLSFAGCRVCLQFLP